MLPVLRASLAFMPANMSLLHRHLIALLVLSTSLFHIQLAHAVASIYVDAPPTLIAALAAIDNSTDGQIEQATPALFGWPQSDARFNGSLVWAGDGLMMDGSDATTGCGVQADALFNYSSNPTWRQLVDVLREDSVILMIQRGGCQFGQKILKAQLSNARVTAVLILDADSSWPIHMNDGGLAPAIVTPAFLVFDASAAALLQYWTVTRPSAGETLLTVDTGGSCPSGLCPASSSGAAEPTTGGGGGGLSTGATVAIAVVVSAVGVTVAAMMVALICRRRQHSARAEVGDQAGQEFASL